MKTEIATLGGGCFWCLEAIYDQLKGIKEVVSGYAGGHVAQPSYQEVCTGTTGHAEVVQIAFDPELISYKQILRIFFTIHEPTTPNRQGADIGPQYRSIILYHSAEQRAMAQEVMAEIEAEKIWDAPLVTELQPFEVFYPAEEYHQQYFQRNPSAGYCRVVIAPKVAKFRKEFMDQLKDR
jgi:peptide-methionine (S)-S-oxide reductase